MASKVRVYAKSQKWAALGIVDAYLKIYPNATLEDINKAFPRNLFVETEGNLGLFVTMAEKEKMTQSTTTDFDDNQLKDWKSSHYYLTLSDGTDIAFTVAMWTKEMFEKIIEQAKLYDIEIAKYEAAEKGIGKRGSYTLEYLNGFVPVVPVAAPIVVKKGAPAWLWALISGLIVAIIALILWWLMGNKTVEVEKVVVVHDTIYIQQIEKNFNAIQFAWSKANLSEEAKFVLHDLAKVLNNNSNLKVKIQGHTSADGYPSFNQKLSENRAKVVVNYLVKHKGVSIEQLSYEGLGSSSLKNTANPKSPENRRTELIIIE